MVNDALCIPCECYIIGVDGVYSDFEHDYDIHIILTTSMRICICI